MQKSSDCCRPSPESVEARRALGVVWRFEDPPQFPYHRRLAAVPSMVPPPIRADATPLALMSGRHAPEPVLLPAHWPGRASKSVGYRDAKRVTPVSIQSVTPDFIVSGPDTKASLLPLVTSFTDCPDGQAVMAAWIATVSSGDSADGVPPGALFVAVMVVQGGGIVGSLPMASQVVGYVGAAPPVP